MSLTHWTSANRRPPVAWLLLATLAAGCDSGASAAADTAKASDSPSDTAPDDSGTAETDGLTAIPDAGIDSDGLPDSDSATLPDLPRYPDLPDAADNGPPDENTWVDEPNWGDYKWSKDEWVGAPGCQAQLHTTPKGCQSCYALATDLPAAISEVLGTTDACAADGDCTEIANPKPICGYACPLVLATDATAAGAKAYASLASDWCSQTPAPYKIDCTYPCKQGKLQCVAGQCRKVGLCDPLVAAVGSPCDDGNACTVQDACSGPGACKGQPANCNDDNPCTADSCVATKGCVNSALAGICSSGVSCSAAANCQAGNCVDSGLKGWTKRVNGPESLGSAGLAPLPGGGYAVAWRGNAELLKIKRFSATGALLWETSGGQPQSSVTSIVGVGSDQIAVAGSHYPAGGQGSVPYLLRLAGDGTSLGWAQLPLGKMTHLQLTVVPAGLLVSGGTYAADNKWNALVAMLDTSGKVLWQTDLGPTANYGSGIHIAAGSGGYAVLSMVPGAKNVNGDQADLHFVRLSAQGAKLTDVIWPTPDYDYASGIAGLPQGGWLLTSTAIALGPKLDKTFLGVLRVVDDAGKVLETTTSPLTYPTGFAVQSGGSTLLSNTTGPTGATTLVQPLGADGKPTTGWQIPPWPAGNSYQPVAVESDGSAVFLRSTSASKTLTLQRIWPPCNGAGCPTPACN